MVLNSLRTFIWISVQYIITALVFSILSEKNQKLWRFSISYRLSSEFSIRWIFFQICCWSQYTAYTWCLCKTMGYHVATLTFFFGSHDFNTEKLLLTNRSLKFVRTVDFAYFLFHLSRAAGTYGDVGTGPPPPSFKLTLFKSGRWVISII